MKKKSKQFTARGDRNVVQWSPLESIGDGSLIITERIYLILESIELHRMCPKSLMNKLLTPKDDIFKVTVRLDNADNLCLTDRLPFSPTDGTPIESIRDH